MDIRLKYYQFVLSIIVWKQKSPEEQGFLKLISLYIMSDLCVTLVSKNLIYMRKLRFLEAAQALVRRTSF